MKMNKSYGIMTDRPNPQRPGEFLWTKCIQMRWDMDEVFRKQMEDLHYIREDMVEMDEIAESPGQGPSRRGDGTGRTRQDRERTEGFYDRVSVPG